VYDPATASPGVVNLMGILSALTTEPVPAIAARFEGRGYGFLKAEVGEAIIAALTPIQERYAALTDDPATLDRVLDASTERVRAIAATTMARVRRAVGLI
jgi:tryptophanyl-tRNA synthetase